MTKLQDHASKRAAFTNQNNVLNNELVNATHQIEAELVNSEIAMNMLCTKLAEIRQIAIPLTKKTVSNDGDSNTKEERTPMLEKFDSSSSPNLGPFLHKSS